jgi:hypothetical protein
MLPPYPQSIYELFPRFIHHVPVIRILSKALGIPNQSSKNQQWQLGPLFTIVTKQCTSLAYPVTEGTRGTPEVCDISFYQ